MADLQPKSVRRFGQVEICAMSDKRLTAGEFKVYSVLCAHRNSRSGCAFPHRDTLAEITGYHVDYISRATAKLVRLGFLERHRDGRGRGRRTVFRFPLADARAKPHSDCGKPDYAVSEPASTPIREEQTKTTASNPSLTPEPTPRAPRGDFDLSLPNVPPAIVPALLAALRGLPRACAQMLLDEMAGIAQGREIRSPVGYLRRLRQLHEGGQFVPEHAQRIEAERRRRAEIRRAVERASRPPAARGRPTPPHAVPAFIHGLRAALRGSPG
jgi:DNA-binding MarR family transcriptional regulator